MDYHEYGKELRAFLAECKESDDNFKDSKEDKKCMGRNERKEGVLEKILHERIRVTEHEWLQYTKPNIDDKKWKPRKGVWIYFF